MAERLAHRRLAGAGRLLNPQVGRDDLSRDGNGHGRGVAQIAIRAGQAEWVGKAVRTAEAGA